MIRYKNEPTYMMPKVYFFTLFVLYFSPGIIISQEIDNKGAFNQYSVVSTPKYALVFGISDYMYLNKLDSPVLDAISVRDALTDIGVVVYYYENLTKQQMEEAIREFEKILIPDCWAFFYFSGHGIEYADKYAQNASNYLLPKEIQDIPGNEIKYNAFSVDLVINKLSEKVTRGPKIIILDACRKNPFTYSKGTGSNGLSQMSAFSNTLLAYSAAPGQIAQDGGEGNLSPYTGQLIKNLKLPGLKIEELFSQVGKEVIKISDYKQQPWISYSLDRDYILVSMTNDFKNESEDLSKNNFESNSEYSENKDTYNISDNDYSKSYESINQKLFIANIRSQEDDIEYSIENTWSSKEVPSRDELESIDQMLIIPINEEYKSLILTNLITDFKIETEDDLKKSYLEMGKIADLNFSEDFTLAYKYFLGILPHLYKYKQHEKYWLLIEFTGNILGAEIRITTSLDSIPYILDEVIQKEIDKIKKILFLQGKIMIVNNDEAIIKFDSEMNTPVVGSVLKSSREYKRPRGWESGTNHRRLFELEKALIYYGTIEEWIQNIDTSNYEYSFREYNDLKNGYWDMYGCDFYLDLEIELIITEISDSTALGKIQYKRYPWMELEPGDRVELK
ncbi:MAG: caspase family protein [Bacteroidales bacterium]|nr:caspase family protein [Bacteroidales bacterium]